jgi:hypothetical protein
MCTKLACNTFPGCTSNRSGCNTCLP